MQIAFRKISREPSKLLLQCDGIEARGTFRSLSQGMVALECRLSGTLEVGCDRCGAQFELEVDEALSLRVSDGCSDEEALDIVESHSGEVDFDRLIESEIEAIRSDYHYCSRCRDKTIEE